MFFASLRKFADNAITLRGSRIDRNQVVIVQVDSPRAQLCELFYAVDRIERGPSATISRRRSGTIAPMPPIRMPRLPKLAKPHSA